MIRWSSKDEACIVCRPTTRHRPLYINTSYHKAIYLQTYECYKLASPAPAPASLHPPPRMASRYTSNSASPLTYHQPSPTRPTYDPMSYTEVHILPQIPLTPSCNNTESPPTNFQPAPTRPSTRCPSTLYSNIHTTLCNYSHARSSLLSLFIL